MIEGIARDIIVSPESLKDDPEGLSAKWITMLINSSNKSVSYDRTGRRRVTYKSVRRPGDCSCRVLCDEWDIQPDQSFKEFLDNAKPAVLELTIHPCQEHAAGTYQEWLEQTMSFQPNFLYRHEFNPKLWRPRLTVEIIGLGKRKIFSGIIPRQLIWFVLKAVLQIWDDNGTQLTPRDLENLIQIRLVDYSPEKQILQVEIK